MEGRKNGYINELDGRKDGYIIHVLEGRMDILNELLKEGWVYQ